MRFIENFFSYIKDIYTERLSYFPSNITVSLLIVLFCAIALIELYIYIAFRHLNQTGKKSRESQWTERIDNMLANLIIFDESDDADEIVDHFYPKLRKLPLKNSIVRQVITTQMMTYHRNFTGKPAEIMEILFRRLQLDKVSRKKLRNKNWEVKIEGIREANEMVIVEMADEIIKYTDDENGLLRMEAQAAYIKLCKQDPFHFLDRARERILDWHQVILFEIITKHKELKIPSFSKWLRSPNDTVVMFCLKLIEHFMQFDAADEVGRLLKHHNSKIVKKSAKIIGKLELENVEKEMFEVYFDNSEEIKIQILNSLGKISSGNYNEFIFSRIYSSSVKIKKAALYAIKKQPGNGLQKLNELYKQTTLENQLLIKHVLDDRIKQ